MRVEPLEDRRMLAVDLQLVGDFNLQPTSALPSSFLPSLVNTSNITPVGDVVYFTASTFDHGNELWKSDGTAEGTVLVKDIIPGPAGSQYRHLEAVGNTLYFQAISPTTGSPELWKSDGTEAGTVVVRSRNNGGPWNPFNLTNVDGTLYFIGSSIYHGRELWKSDGTVAGTVMVKDIVTGFGDAFADLNFPTTGTPQPYFTAVGSTLYFIATNQSFYSTGRELWKSDGTPEGTVVVKDIRSGPGSVGTFDFNFVDPQLTAVGDTLYFVADDFTNGAELWRSDAAEGAVMVKNITPFSGSTFNATSHKLVNFDGALYFTRVAGGGTQLWTSDGSSDGTVQIVQMQANNVNELIVAGSRLYFSASSPSAILGLWSSDGTALGTAKVKDSSSPFFPATLGLVASGNAVYFSAQDFASGYELWRSDGTPTGTAILRDIYPGTRSSNPASLADADGTLFFAADDGTHGFELWATHGSFAETRLVKDIRDGTASFAGLANGNAELNGMIFFAGNNGATGMELWRTDGTAAGTQLVADLRAGSRSSTFTSFKRFGNAVYFLADTEDSVSKLWRTDGTAAGTALIFDVGQTTGLNPLFTEFDGWLYFRGGAGGQGTELVRTDGTASGTTVVKDITPEGSTAIEYIVVAGDKLYFRAQDVDHGSELWVTDGTEAGTVLVKDISPGSAGSAIFYPTAVGDLLYFSADDGAHGRELWRSDGTAVGTAMVADLYPDGSSSPRELVNVNGTLYFVADDIVADWQVWKLAPGAATPELLTDIGGGVIPPTNLTNVDGTLFFAAFDSGPGFQLWKSDAAGTGLVKDFAAGDTPAGFTNIEGVLYFTVNDGVHGQELWSSDGTPEGTQLGTDLAPGLASSSPVVTVLGSRLLVQATTGPYGAELWSATLTPSQAGDYDFDDDVDGHDFLAWQRNLGSPVSPEGSGADGDESGTIDAGDLNVWHDSYGATSAQSAAANLLPSFSETRNASFGETGQQLAADAVFAAGDFTQLFATSAEDSSTIRSYRPRRRR